ncbi:MAG: hypothetical protein U9R40_03370 [Synergistota bacterium]|nr:hypothetical protein [Synergistota bacterium]
MKRLLVAVCIFALTAMPATAAETPLAFTTRDGNINLIASEGTAPEQIARGRYPDISPDGKRMVYVSDDDASLMVMDLASGSRTTLARSEPRIMAPSWSPSGDRVAFFRFDENYRKELLIVEATGGTPHKIPLGNMDPVACAAWTPDGSSLMLQDIFHLYLVSPADGVEAEAPLEAVTGERDMSTSTDRFLPHPLNADPIAFTMSVPGTKEFEEMFNEYNQALFLYDTVTKERKRLTPEDMLATDIRWTRDGSAIYFSGYRTSDMKEQYPFKIYRLDMATGEITEVCAGEEPAI